MADATAEEVQKVPKTEVSSDRGNTNTETTSLSNPSAAAGGSKERDVTVANNASAEGIVGPSGRNPVPRVDEIPMTGYEAGFYKLLMNPLLNQMQESVDKSNEILDDLLRKMKDDREQARKRQLSSHIPLVLQGSGRELTDIIKQVDNLIAYENYNPEQPMDESNLIKAYPRQLDKTGELAIVSHGIAAYVSMLDAQHLKHLATRVVTELTGWLAKIFRFPEGAAHFHEEEKEGLVRICQLAIHKKYPKFATDGYEVLYPRPPVIYISASAKHNLGQYLCHQLGLPLSCLCTVPCQMGVMDTVALQKLIEDDQSSGKTPVIVIAYAGTPLAGRVDNLTRLQELCQQFNVWLHLEGSSLSMLASPAIPAYLNSAVFCNSMTLNLCAWLALPAVPFVTLFKSPDVMLTRAAGLSTFNVRYKLNCLSLWMCLQHLGFDKITARLQYHSHLAKTIHERVQKIATTNQILVLDFQGPSVIFRYQLKPGEAEAGVDTSKNGLEEEDKLKAGYQHENERDPYFDTLNIWLAETLKREVPEVHVTAVDIEKIGLCIRFAPLETSYTLNSSTIFETSGEDVGQFLDCLDHHIKILDATVRMRKEFQDIVENQDNMRIVHLPTWAGLGAVQYIPEAWLNKLENLSEQGKNEINSINHQMVNQLKSTDSAFSLGQTESGLYCVRFGLVTMDTDLEELIAIVYTTGKDVEESSRFLESMSDIVRQGIEKAAEDLVKENQDKLMQEGVLRQVPLVGSLINWWSPPPKDMMKGRTFNLASGKVASTEDTYKSHIQILESFPDLSPKARDGPLKVNLKPSKSREYQHSSSESSIKQEIGQGEQPAQSSGDRELQPLADGVPVVADGAAHENRLPDSSTPLAKETLPAAAAVDVPTSGAEQTDLK